VFVFLKEVFKQNGYNDRHIHRAYDCRPHLAQPDNQPKPVVFLPIVETIFNNISRVLARHDIKSVGLCHMKLSSVIRPVKDHLGLRILGVCRIALSAAESTLGRVYPSHSDSRSIRNSSSKIRDSVSMFQDMKWKFSRNPPLRFWWRVKRLCRKPP
jgi:hypothetical protein